MNFLSCLDRYVYDLKMPARESPEYQPLRPFDDEVDSFQVCTNPKRAQILASYTGARPLCSSCLSAR